jgi:hypothetical protein
LSGAQLPEVFTFNLAWAGGPETPLSSEEILNVLMLMPNMFDPFTLFKRKTG